MATLSAVDYVVFVVVLVLSAAIGLYHAFAGGRQATTEEFFVADRRMQFVPVGFSILASWVSAIAVMGNPSEMYVYGTMYWYIIGIYMTTTFITIQFFIPVFYELRLSSVYEYLQLRFSYVVRIIGTSVFILNMVLYLSVVLYAPSVAVSAVTGLYWWLSVIIVGVVCTVYTALGGIKAVIWTDVFQTLVIIGCFVVIAIHGVVTLGGFSNVWEINQRGGRIVFDDIRFDPRIRHTVWSIMIGGSFTWLALYASNQMSIQRYLSCESLKAAKATMLVGCPLFIVFASLSFFCGLIIYAVYVDCDPVEAEYISGADQILPYYVVNKLGHLKGLPGMFVAAILSGTLSTISSGLNSLAVVTVKDIIKVIKKDMPDKQETAISKVIATLYGVLAIALALAASQMGPILTLTLKIFGVLGGPLLGLFILGIFFPWANTKGAIVGTAVGFCVAILLGVGAFVYPPDNPRLPMSIHGCVEAANMTTPIAYTAATTSWVVPEDPQTSSTHSFTDFYHVSYMYYGLISVFVVNFVGLLVSFITGATDPKDLDPRLLTPVSRTMFCCCPATCRDAMDCGVGDDVISIKSQTDTYCVTDDDQKMSMTTTTQLKQESESL